MKESALTLIVILTAAWMLAQVLNYLDWKIRERRIWRNVERRIQGK